MFVIVGWLVALGCIFGVFIVHGGNIEIGRASCRERV